MTAEEFSTKITDAGISRVFKEHIQAIVKQILGIEVSIDKAYRLYKAMEFGTVQFAMYLDRGNKKLSMMNISSYGIRKTLPRGSKVKTMAFVPRVKLKASKEMQKYIERYYNVGNHEGVNEQYGIFKE